jgi:FlgD Ig-like domain
VRRFGPLLVVLALLAATAAAFAVTERLKLERAPIAAPDVTKTFSPVCRCATDVARVAFRLRRADTIALWIVDAEGNIVRRLVESRRVPAGRFEASWDGRDGDGVLVEEGVYRPRVRFARGRRIFVLRNPIRVDMTPPRITLVSARPEFFSPDGDGRNDRVRVRFRLSERANALLFVNGVQRVRTRFRPTTGALDWFGRVDGRQQRAGLYRLSLSAEDAAGNLAPRTKPAFVEISYIALARETIRVRARTRFGVRVTTDAARFRWRFAGGTGTARPGLLVLRAPRAGRYTLFVETNDHADRAQVRVRVRRKA